MGRAGIGKSFEISWALNVFSCSFKHMQTADAIELTEKCSKEISVQFIT